MAKETQKSKIERLEKENEELKELSKKYKCSAGLMSLSTVLQWELTTETTRIPKQKNTDNQKDNNKHLYRQIRKSKL